MKKFKYEGMLTKLVALIIGVACFSLHAKDVVYAGVDRKAYHVSLLKQALSYFPDKKYNIKGFGHDIPKPRSFILMEKNEGVDVMIGTSTKEREEKYLPVRFPILKGLNGWRVALINPEHAELFKHVTSRDALEKLTPGQFHAWTDTKILESNNIKVTKGSDHQGLYRMLAKNRIDYFPRSILEAEWDAKRNAHLGLIIDPYVLIKYPNAYYFYLSKDNTELANDILKGLELALADGSFDKLFQANFGDVLARLKVDERRVFDLQNPFLLDPNLLNRKELWANVDNASEQE